LPHPHLFEQQPQRGDQAPAPASTHQTQSDRDFRAELGEGRTRAKPEVEEHRQHEPVVTARRLLKPQLLRSSTPT
jgi:hypothetical protein